MGRPRAILDHRHRVAILALAIGMAASSCGSGTEATDSSAEDEPAPTSTTTVIDTGATDGSTTADAAPTTEPTASGAGSGGDDDGSTAESTPTPLRLLGPAEVCELVDTERVEAVMGPSNGPEPGPDTTAVFRCSWRENDDHSLPALVAITVGTHADQAAVDIDAGRTDGAIPIAGTDWAVHTPARPSLAIGELLQAGTGLQYIWVNLAPGPDGGDIEGGFDLAVEIIEGWVVAAAA